MEHVLWYILSFHCLAKHCTNYLSSHFSRPAYNAAETRADKTQVVQTIYDILTSVGRFVKEDPPTASCVVIDVDAAKKKISHAIVSLQQQFW